MKLYLVRHGDSVSSDVDPDQPLSKKGVLQTEAVGELLKGAKLQIDEIQHSTKSRAQQTAEILKKKLALQCPMIKREGLKPMDPVEPIADEVRSQDHNLMLVGHLPFMERLLSVLILNHDTPILAKFCGSAVVCLEKNDRQWHILWMATPDLNLG